MVSAAPREHDPGTRSEGSGKGVDEPTHSKDATEKAALRRRHCFAAVTDRHFLHETPTEIGPLGIEMRRQPRHEHEVSRPFSDPFVGDVAASGISSFGVRLLSGREYSNDDIGSSRSYPSLPGWRARTPGGPRAH